MRQGIYGCHPVVQLVFFAGAMGFGMCLLHPAFIAMGLLLAAAAVVCVTGRKGANMLPGLAAVLVAVTAVNPLFNPGGDSVLFTYFGRNFTLEALAYGGAAAAMFVTVLMWFACFNAVMTSDRLLYLFGALAPAVSLVLTMTLRLVPAYQRKTASIRMARRCVGLAPESGSRRHRLVRSMDILSALTGWALEGGIITADAMAGRGYGSAKRTRFSLFRFTWRDGAALGVLLLLAGGVIAGILGGGLQAAYQPGFDVAWNGFTLMGGIAYALFLAAPTILYAEEVITWRILRRKI